MRLTEHDIVEFIAREREWEVSARRRQKQREREAFLKWIMLCAAVVIMLVLALVWAGKLQGAVLKPYAVAERVAAGQVRVRCLNGADATVLPPDKFGELTVSCGTLEPDSAKVSPELQALRRQGDPDSQAEADTWVPDRLGLLWLRGSGRI